MNKLACILNGPNLNLLGKRQPHIYGTETLADAEADCRKTAMELGIEIRFLQSNAEHRIIDWIHEARETASGIHAGPTRPWKGVQREYILRVFFDPVVLLERMFDFCE
jgi:3-dehydroquinate dehydratase II